MPRLWAHAPGAGNLLRPPPRRRTLRTMATDVSKRNRPRRPARERADAAFRQAFGGPPDVRSRAPGRVNILGGHVDYNDGYVLPAAIDRDAAVAARRRSDGHFLVVADDLDESDRFDVDDVADGVPRASARGWRAYVRGVVALLRERGVNLDGAELTIAGDVPRGSGLASSAALELSVARALLGLAGTTLPGAELAALGRRAETIWAGVQCGIMDQMVAALGRRGHALFLDCRSLAYSHVPLPPGVRLVAVDSGVRRDVGGSAYNRRVEECREAARLLGVRSLRDVALHDLEAAADAMPTTLYRRARHVVDEIHRTFWGAQALTEGDVARVGALVDASHDSLRDNYEVSTPELDRLVEIQRAQPGVLGARMLGAGFGGSTLALVEEPAALDFARAVPPAYAEATGLEAEVHVFTTADGASLE